MRKSERKSEQGQTLVLVAIAIVSLLGMAALAIDVVTLYVARGEAQRAADAAAIAGAKMFVTSGFTSVQAGGGQPTAADVCQSSGPGNAAAANQQAEAAAGRNQVAGQAAAVSTISCNFTEPRNPQITVTVQRTGLPTFLARIWSRSSITVTASATAEAYNPSGLTAPVQMVGVKPWFVPNCDPTDTTPPLNATKCGGVHSYFVSPADGSIANNGSFIGQTIDFQRIDAGTAPTVSTPPAKTDFYALDVPDSPPTAPVCPSTAGSCGLVGTNDYLDNIACTSTFPFSCGQTIGTGQPVTLLTGGGLGGYTREGARCLIHADNDNVIDGQDLFAASGGSAPVTITGGTENPNPSLQSVANISRSDSVVTVPLYDGSKLCTTAGPGCTLTTTIVGFLQLGVKETITGPTRIQAVILNAAGCNPGNTGNPVSGSGTSPLPVRLISP